MSLVCCLCSQVFQQTTLQQLLQAVQLSNRTQALILQDSSMRMQQDMSRSPVNSGSWTSSTST
jgi:hypothetical protein